MISEFIKEQNEYNDLFMNPTNKNNLDFFNKFYKTRIRIF